MTTQPDFTVSAHGAFDEAGVWVIESEVTFLDSSALNAFVQAQQDLAQQDVAFRIVSPADHAVRNVFEITRLIRIFPVYDTIEDAVAAATAAGGGSAPPAAPGGGDPKPAA